MQFACFCLLLGELNACVACASPSARDSRSRCSLLARPWLAEGRRPAQRSRAGPPQGRFLCPAIALSSRRCSLQQHAAARGAEATFTLHGGLAPSARACRHTGSSPGSSRRRCAIEDACLRVTAAAPRGPELEDWSSFESPSQERGRGYIILHLAFPRRLAPGAAPGAAGLRAASRRRRG